MGTKLARELVVLGACDNARRWAFGLDTDDHEAAWELCPGARWLGWYVGRTCDSRARMAGRASDLVSEAQRLYPTSKTFQRWRSDLDDGRLGDVGMGLVEIPGEDESWRRWGADFADLCECIVEVIGGENACGLIRGIFQLRDLES